MLDFLRKHFEVKVALAHVARDGRSDFTGCNCVEHSFHEAGWQVWVGLGNHFVGLRFEASQGGFLLNGLVVLARLQHDQEIRKFVALSLIRKLAARVFRVKFRPKLLQNFENHL